MNLRKLHIVLIILLLSATAKGQYLVGKHVDEIKQIIKNEHKLLKLNTTNVNKAYNYLKYEDKINEITVLFFLDETNHCKMVRMMYDYSNINDVLTFLKSDMKKTGLKEYEYKIDKKTLSVVLSEDDWFFTVTAKEKK